MTLIGKTPDGRIVAKETVDTAGEAAALSRQWKESGLAVEIVRNATEVLK